MKLIIFILLFFSLSSVAQKKKTVSVTTLTSKQLTVLTASLQARLDAKDKRDDDRNASIKRLSEKMDSAVILNPKQFEIDSNNIASYIIKPDTFVIYKKSPKVPLESSSVTIARIDEASTLIIPQPGVTTKEMSDLKFQIQQLEQLLDDDKKLIDKLQKKIKQQQATITNLKKK